MASITLAQTSQTPEKIADYVALLQSTFPDAMHRYSSDYLRWLYYENPDGPVIGFDAWDGGRMVAHYVCVPLRARIRGTQPRRVLLSLNTATHPDYQGRGLFLKLATETYKLAAEGNYDAVVGVANANSTHGFVNRLGFQLVSPLDARIGLGSLRIDAAVTGEAAEDFMRVWSRDAIKWRLLNPFRQSRLLSLNDDTAAFVAPSTNPVFIAWTERPTEPDWSLIPRRILTDLRARVFVGLIPPVAVRTNLYWNIPNWLRPVPLNLIYKPLSGNVPPLLAASKVFFDFLDFDAF